MGKVVDRNVIGINANDNNICRLSYLGSSGIAKINKTDPILVILAKESRKLTESL
jgi:hypothetical protein